MLYYIMIYLLRLSAFFLIGMQTYCTLFQGSPLSDMLLILGFAGLEWLFSFVPDYLLGHPKPPVFLNTWIKWVIAAIVAFLVGFRFLM